MLKEKPELVASMVAASQDAWKAYLGDPSTANAEIFRRNPEMDVGILQKSSGGLSALMLIDEGATTFGMMTDPRWNELAATLHEIGVLENELSADEIKAAYTTRFLGR